MPDEFIKRDRLARLLGVARLLYQHPHGLTAREIADRVGVNKRTVNRDLQALEEEVDVKFWKEGNRYVVEQSSFLPPLKLTLHEAVTLFLSARLVARYQDRRDPHVISLFNKLATIVPTPIARHMGASIVGLARRRGDDTRNRVFDILATAWAEGRKVRIWYAGSSSGGQITPSERLVSPYLLEPKPGGHTLYLIGYDNRRCQIRTFKVERIQQVELTAERFEIPPEYDPSERLAHAWGISDEDLVEVRLRFHDRKAAERARESNWHPSQREEVHADGTIDLTFEVGGVLEITPWVLSWGGAVEVLYPLGLRSYVAAAARTQAGRYGPPPEEADSDETHERPEP
jgi:predicted DNA-binding transcriptional regulator YafY